MIRTIEEIRDKILERYDKPYDGLYAFNNIMDETGKYLSQYDDEDEFYTDFDKFYPKDYAETELYEHSKAIEFINKRDYRKELKFYIEDDILDKLLFGYSYPQDYFKEAVKEFVFEDYDDFMDFYMEGNYDEDTGNDSALN